MAFTRGVLRFVLPAALIAVVLVLVSVAEASSAEPRIIAGNDVSITDHPYQVAIDVAGLGSCGGSIRDATHVVTAAHCVVSEDGFFPAIVPPGRVTVGYGNSDRNLLNTGAVVDQISVYPQYLRDPASIEFDVAVLTLENPINLSPSAKAIPFASDAELGDAAEGFVTGWGLTEERGTTSPALLRGTPLPLRLDATCIAHYGDVAQGGAYNSDLMICAGGEGTAPSGNPDTCQGDSGGPLAIDTNLGAATSYELVGIVSFGDGCGRARTPGVYAWVQSTLLQPFLADPTPAEPPGVPGQNPTTGGTPRVGQALTCNAPAIPDGAPAQYVWSVFNPPDGTFTVIALTTAPRLDLSPSTQGARLICDLRYENEGGFAYSDAPPSGAVGPVLPAPVTPVTPPPPAADRTPPKARIGKVSCKRGKCTIKVGASDVGGLVRSLSAKLTYKVKRCRRVGGRRRCRSVKKTKKLQARESRGGFTLTTRLKPGKYTVTAVATDTSSNRSNAARKAFRVKRR